MTLSRRILVVTLVAVSSTSGLGGASSSKPKEIVVVGSPIRSAAFSMPYAFDSQGSLVAPSSGQHQEVARYNFFEAWPAKVSGPGLTPAKNLVELGVSRDGQPVGRVEARLECRPPSGRQRSGDAAPAKATLVELGFSETTPILVKRSGQGHVLRFGDAMSAHGRCALVASLAAGKGAGR